MRLQKKIFKSLVFIVFFFCILFINPKQILGAVLTNANDYITDETPERTNVKHQIGFFIPQTTTHELQETDYVIITFTNYSDVTPPTLTSGWTTGTPIISIDSNRVLITGVSAIRNTGIGISGITATNPLSTQNNFVTIQTSNDSSGSIIYDQVVIQPKIIKRNVSTSLTIAPILSSFQFIGFTSPNALVTIYLNESVAGTVIADNSGNYDKQISGLQPNINYSIRIFAHDTNGLNSDSVLFSALTLPKINFLISDIVVPTTITTTDSIIFEGDNLVIFGRAHPYSQVTLFIGQGMEHAVVVQVSSQGNWGYTYNSYDLPLATGSHQIVAQEIVTGEYTSQLTTPINFNLSLCKIADLNCDTRVNLTDFSILMYYWNKTNPGNRRSDINKDGIVNISDYYLMSYYWEE